jgi:hypothetical protein
MWTCPLHCHELSCKQPTKSFLVFLVHSVISKDLLTALQGPTERTASQKFKRGQVLRRHLLFFVLQSGKLS